MIDIAQQIKVLRDKILPQNSKGSSLRAQLVKSSGGIFLLKISNLCSQFVITVILARLLGAEGYGSYAFVMALVTLLSMPTTLGFPMLLVRQIAVYSVRSEWGMIRGLLQRANQLVLLLSLLVGGILVLGSYVFADLFNPTAHSLLMVAVILLPLLSLNALRGAALRGLNKVVTGFVPESIIQHWVFILLVGAGYVFVSSTLIDVRFIMILQVAATFTALLVGTGLLIHYLPAEVKVVAPTYDYRVWIKSARSFLLIGSMQIMNHQIDLVMVGAMLGDIHAGVYRVATRCAEVIPFVLLSVNMVLGPTISKFYALKDMQRLQRIATKSARAILFFSFPIIFIFIFYGRWILSTVFGTEFTIGTASLAILSLGQLVYIGTGSVSLLLNMTGHEGSTAKISGLATLLNIVLNVTLIPMLGIEGAALATATSISVSNLFLAIQVSRKLNINATAFGRIHS